MADLDYQLDQDSNKVSTIGCISPKAKIIISISIVAIFLIALIIIILVVTLEEDEKDRTLDPTDFTIINDIVPDIITELRYFSTYNFVGDKIDGYEEPIAILTKVAAEHLKNASDDFDRQGYRIKIWDSYRPQRAVSHFMRWIKDESDIRMKKYFYPNEDKSNLVPKGYIAERSGHSHGSTLDMTLIYKDNATEVDFGTGFDYFGEQANTNHTEGLTPEQIKNRHILNDTMSKYGFVNLYTEWWHYTLKNEPFPQIYFDFPVNGTIIRLNGNK